MRERYWTMYYSVKYKEFYYQSYLETSKRIDDILTCIILIFSATSIASWAIWQYVPWIWAIIVVLVQAFGAYSPRLPFAQRVMSLKFLLPQLRILTSEMDSHWCRIDGYDDEKINDLFDLLNAKYNDLKNRYVSDDIFSDSKVCEEKAETKCRRYFDNNYLKRK